MNIKFITHIINIFDHIGTGAKDKTSPFLNVPTVEYHHSTERNLVGMIADISRIRPNDKIIFYLQASSNNKGMFFGVFKADSLGFFDENDDKNYLKKDLGKGLSFRVKISPDYVYQYGITEHEYLDDLTKKEAPYQLCWSMIYRKLKGNRGCTMITQYEFEDLESKLKAKNNETFLKVPHFSFDSKNVMIVPKKEAHKYCGKMEDLSIKARLLYKANKNKAFETHLQAFILQNFDKDILREKLLKLNNGNAWIGNEVSCGVGMQRIDITIIEQSDTEIHLRIIELKDEEPVEEILMVQLPWYIKWISQYIIPNFQQYKKIIYIHPCIIAKKTDNKEMINKIKNNSLSDNSDKSDIIVQATEYIGFEISDTEITFDKIV